MPLHEDMRHRKFICAKLQRSDGLNTGSRPSKADDPARPTDDSYEPAMSNSVMQVYTVPCITLQIDYKSPCLTRFVGAHTDHGRADLPRASSFRREHGPLDGGGSKSSSSAALGSLTATDGISSHL